MCKTIGCNSDSSFCPVANKTYNAVSATFPEEEALSSSNHIFNGGNTKKDGNRRFLTVKGKSAYWTRKSHGKHSLNKKQVKQLTSHLIKETYFKIGNKLCQVSSILFCYDQTCM